MRSAAQYTKGVRMKTKKASELTHDDVGKGISIVFPNCIKPRRTLIMRYVTFSDMIILHVCDPIYPSYLGTSVPIHLELDADINFCPVDRKKWGYSQDALQRRH